jgi:hypothetical protein
VVSITIAVYGAAGSMGTRASTSFAKHADEFEVLHVEATGEGEQKLRDRGDEPTASDVACGVADVIILAVPDRVIGDVAHGVVPGMKAGAMLICLDPAAPHAGRLPDREDITIFVAHPAHPPVFNDETEPAARKDYFGSGLAKQAIVCALMRGPEKDYALGERIASTMWGPVLRSHRVTVKQMAILEPALSETVTATCLTVIREAMDESIKRGVPAAAARDFLLGHINVELAILFDEIGWDFSDGCKQAIEKAKGDIFQPDWKKVFDDEHLSESVRYITGV